MKDYILSFALIASSLMLFGAGEITRTPLMVDENQNLNAEGVASVEDVATNAVKVQIAVAKAEAVEQTAIQVKGDIDTVVDNIMSNNVVVYRKGFADSFAAYVVFTDNDKLLITDVVFRRTGANLEVDLEYVCTADVGAIKPRVMHHSTLQGGRENFDELADSNVTTPVFHSGTQTVENDKGESFTVSGYYTLTSTVAGAGSENSYFIWIKIDADVPSGQGMTLDLVNGVTGGKTQTVHWGGYVLDFVGGVLKGVVDE